MNGLKVTVEGGETYYFEVLSTHNNPEVRGIGLTIENNQGERVGTNLWRYQLHPFDYGLASDRISTARAYNDANADASYYQFFTAPPRVYTLTLPNATGCTNIVDFAGETFFLCGRYVYRVSPTYTVTQDRDLGAGVTGTDMVVFNNELIVACGTSGYIQKRSAGGTWTVSTDVQADKLAVVNDRLWRSLSNNLFSCSTAPQNASSYIQSNNVGDTTYKINALLEYGGIPWPIKENGAYQADVSEIFKNQTPQIAKWPNSQNGRGSFVAKGSLFVPTINGLLEVNRGVSRFVGPETADRGVSGLITYAGLEWQGIIYLVCMDASNYGAYIVKMIANENKNIDRLFIYHQFCQLGSGAAVPACIGMTTLPTNPTMYIGMTTGTTVYYITLGRGAGRDIDDPNYKYQSTFYLKTGRFQPVNDLSVESIFHGVDVVTSLGHGDRLSVAVSADNGPFIDMATSMEVAGVTALSATAPLMKTRLYAPRGLAGKTFDVLLYGASDINNAGTVRPEIYEVWAFGFARPIHHDVIEVALKVSSTAKVSGVSTGISFNEAVQLWRDWIDSVTLLTINAPFLSWIPSGRYIAVDMQITPIAEKMGIPEPRQYVNLSVRLVRVNYG